MIGIPAFMVVEELGLKVIEMAERVATAHKAAPGSFALFGFNLDGAKFECVIRIKPEVRR